MEEFAATFMCQECQTVVQRMAGEFDIWEWTCAVCGLDVQNRAARRPFNCVGGLQRWLGEQLVDHLFENIRFRAALLDRLRPAFGALTKRTLADDQLAGACLDLIISVLGELHDPLLTDTGKSMVAEAHARDVQALERRWFVSVGNADPFVEPNEQAVMIEGPPDAADRARGRWFWSVYAFVFRKVESGWQLHQTAGWTGSLRPPTQSHP
jgi:hypothetical protein